MPRPDAREMSARILREAGLSPKAIAETVRAQEAMDARLAGLGLPASRRPPARLEPGQEAAIQVQTPIAVPGAAPGVARSSGPNFLSASRGASAALLVPGGVAPPVRVVPASGGLEISDAMFEPFDLIAAQAVTALATIGAGGTEVRFNLRGFVHVGSGAVGVYWNRPLGANQNFRWVPCSPGLLIPYDPRQGLFVGTNTAGGITLGGVLTLSFYRLPEIRPPARRDERERPPADSGGSSGDQPGDPGAIDPGAGSRAPDRDSGRPNIITSVAEFRAVLAARLAASGSDMTAGAFVGASGGGPDVTLGSFSDAGAGTQIFLAGSNMPVGGASRAGTAILNSRPANTDTVWVGETGALAVASNGGIGPSGQDSWNIPVAGTLFMLALSGTQVLGARYRS